MLSPDQTRQWRDDGYVVLPGFKTAAQVAALRERAAALVEAFDPAAGSGRFGTSDAAERAASRDRWFLDSGDQVRCFFEEEALDATGQLVVPKARSINKIGHALHHLDPVFAAFSLAPDIGALLRALGLARPRIWQSMVIFKQPRIGGEVRWHQDATYLIAEPEPVTGLWFALEEATLANGCLWLQPGGHRGPLRERFVREGDTTRLVTVDRTPWPAAGAAGAVPVPCSAGTVVAFHGLMPHYSAPNRGAVSRLAYTLHASDEAVSTWSPQNWLRTEVASRV